MPYPVKRQDSPSVGVMIHVAEIVFVTLLVSCSCHLGGWGGKIFSQVTAKSWIGELAVMVVFCKLT